MVNILPMTDPDGDGDVILDLSNFLGSLIQLDCVKLTRCDVAKLFYCIEKSFSKPEVVPESHVTPVTPMVAPAVPHSAGA